MMNWAVSMRYFRLAKARYRGAVDPPELPSLSAVRGGGGGAGAGMTGAPRAGDGPGRPRPPNEEVVVVDGAGARLCDWRDDTLGGGVSSSETPVWYPASCANDSSASLIRSLTSDSCSSAMRWKVFHRMSSHWNCRRFRFFLGRALFRPSP